MEWETLDGGAYSDIEGMDPNAEWLLGEGRAALTRGSDEALIPFILTLVRDEALSFFDPAILRDDDPDPITLLMPWLYRNREPKPGDHVGAFATKAFFDRLEKDDSGAYKTFREAKKRIELSLPLNLQSLPTKGSVKPADPPVWRPKGGWPQGTVIVGVIDDGIAFAHERFRTDDGKARVQFFWRQDGQYDANGSTVDFGSEMWKASSGSRKGIDELLAECNDAGLVDEEKLYRKAQLVDFSLPEHKAAAWNLAHGTHVLDVAAGYNSANAPENVPIIAVQLPVATTADTSGAGLGFYVKAAVDYILDRAERLAGPGNPPLPVVINFSYGTIAGPHDGTSGVETSIDKSITDRNAPLSLILPAGNTHLSRCHASMTFARPNERTTLHWHVLPDDLTPTQMQIWMPWDGEVAPKASRATIRVETPWGLLSAALGEQHGHGIRLRDDDGKVVAVAHYCFAPCPTERGVFIISMRSTARLHPPEAPLYDTPTAPSGVWKVHVSNVSLTHDQTVEAWIQRDDVIYGYPRRGRQSYFEAGCYVRFNPVSGDLVKWDHEENDENIKEGLEVPQCHIKRRGLLNAIATGEHTTVVGGVYGQELKVVEYSSGGPITATRGGNVNRLGPDALAVSDDSKIHRGVIAAGSRSGSAVAMNGTSVAAPQIARKVARMLADPTKSGDRDAVRHAAAVEEAAPRGGRPPLQPEIRTGKGRILTARPERPARLDPDF